MYLGGNPPDSGTYNLSGNCSLSTRLEYVGNSGSGGFVQSGGTHSTVLSYLGYNAGASGSYNLSGGLLSASECLGYSGSGSFTQTGGTNTLTYGYLSIPNFCFGYNPGSSGTYTLSGSGLLNSMAPEYIGYLGSGTLTQSGGTNSVNGSLVLGCFPGSNGTYTLSSSAQWNLPPNTYVGYSGSGSLTQSGGAVVTSNGYSCDLYVGYNAGASGTYTLSGSGMLTAHYEYVSYTAGAAAAFLQTGGTNSAVSLTIGSGGRYQLDGGALQLNGGGLESQGMFDAGAATLTGSNCILDLSQGQNLQSLSVSLSGTSLLIVPAGFNAATDFAGFSSSALTHTAGTTLTIPAGTTVTGLASINDPVNCQGTLLAVNGIINLNNGIVLSGTASLGGSLTVNDPASTISGGSLSTSNQYVGSAGTGTLTQSGGINRVAGATYLGNNAGDRGTYILSGSGSVAMSTNEYVGNSGQVRSCNPAAGTVAPIFISASTREVAARTPNSAEATPPGPSIWLSIRAAAARTTW